MGAEGESIIKVVVILVLLGVALYIAVPPLRPILMSILNMGGEVMGMVNTESLEIDPAYFNIVSIEEVKSLQSAVYRMYTPDNDWNGCEHSACHLNNCKEEDGARKAKYKIVFDKAPKDLDTLLDAITFYREKGCSGVPSKRNDWDEITPLNPSLDGKTFEFTFEECNCGWGTEKSFMLKFDITKGLEEGHNPRTMNPLHAIIKMETG